MDENSARNPKVAKFWDSAGPELSEPEYGQIWKTVETYGQY